MRGTRRVAVQGWTAINPVRSAIQIQQSRSLATEIVSLIDFACAEQVCATASKGESLHRLPSALPIVLIHLQLVWEGRCLPAQA